MAAPIDILSTESERPNVTADTATVAAARQADERLTERELLTRCRWIAESFRGIDAATADDVASDLLAYVGNRFGWTPTRREVAGEFLKMWAVAILRKYVDNRLVSIDADAAADDADADERGSIFAEADRRAGIDRVPCAADPDADALCDALGVTDANARMTILAALSGWGNASDVAESLGISMDNAYQRTARGKRALRDQYGNAAALAAAIAAAADCVADPANDADALPYGTNAARRAIESVSGWHADPCQHAAPLPDAWRGLDVPCRVVGHRQDVPEPCRRNPRTPTQRTAGKVPATPTPRPTPMHADAATILRYVARMEAMREALPAHCMPTPNGTPTDRTPRTWGQMMPAAWYAWTD